MQTLGDMVVRIVGDTTELDNSLDKSENKVKKTGEEMQKFGGKMSLFVTTPLLALAGAAVKSSADMEMLQASFETMLGSAEKATGLMLDLKKMGAATPFEVGDLANASKTLLQFGIESEKIIPTLQMLGDASGGNSEKMKSMALVFGQVSSMGKLMGGDLLQLINAGFNPLQELSRTTGKSMAVLKDEMSKGAISADMVAGAFKSATSEGGKFFKGMETSSKTLSGLLSTLADDFGALGRDLLSGLMPIIKDFVKFLSGLAQAFTNLSPNMKAFTLVVLGMIAVTGPLIGAIGSVMVAITALGATATATFVAAAGPIALAIGAITLLVGVFIALGDAMKKAQADADKLEFGAVANELGKSATSAGDVSRELKQLVPLFDMVQADTSKIGYFTDAWKSMVDETSKKYGYTREQTIKVLQATKDITEEQKNTIGLLEKQIKLEDLQRQFQQARQAGYKGTLEAFQKEVEAQQAKFDKQRKQEEDAAKKTASTKAQGADDTAFWAEIELKAKMDANEKEVKDREKAEEAAQKLAEDNGAKIIANDKLKAENKIMWTEKLSALNRTVLENELADLEKEKAAKIKAANDIGEDTSNIEAYYDKLILANKKTTEEEKIKLTTAYVGKGLSIASTFIADLMSFTNKLQENERAKIDERVKKDLEANDLQMQSALELANVKNKSAVESAELAVAMAQRELDGIDELNEAKINALQEEEQAKLYSLGLTGPATLEQYDAEIAKAESTGNIKKAQELKDARTELQIKNEYAAKEKAIKDAQVLEDAQNALKKAQIEQEYADKKKEIEKQALKDKFKLDTEAFIFNQAMAVSKALVDTAGSIIGLLANPGGPAGIAASVAAGVTGALQVATILAQRAPVPNFAEGGVVLPTAGGTLARVAEAGQPEIIFPLDKLERFLSGGSNPNVNNGDGNGNTHLVVQLDSRPILDKIFNATKNKTVLISAGAVV